MIPELGQLALLLALAVSLAQTVLPVLGATRGRDAWIAIARPAAQVQFILVVLAFACLSASFIGNDFSVRYVALNSNRALPAMYRFAAVWGGHEGSLLLWMLMLVTWGVAVAHFSRPLPDVFVARVLAVMGGVGVGFLLFMLMVSNPFERLFPAAPDGRDLNPLLQDPGMVFHPPMLYMGYVGFSVAFAFAVAALMGGQLDAAWARWTRPWTGAAWAFLTLGIAMGSAWAYYELGWGGWWFWDPVENASFMPWLVGTALIHSLAVTEKRGAFKSWTVLLAILAFSLSLLGTFIVRSGVLSSVHAFATDPRRGLFILVFLAIVVGGSLALYAWRAPRIGLGSRFEMLSKESMLLGNNVLLVVMMATVLLGTLYPLALDALGGGKISVGPPYFDTVFLPLSLPLILLVGIGPLARWRAADARELARALSPALVVALVAAIVTAFAVGRSSFATVCGFFMAYWIVAAIVVDLAPLLRSWTRLRSLGRATTGMLLAHLGVAVFAFGVTMVRSTEIERDAPLLRGQSVDAAGYRFTLVDVIDVRGPNYVAAQGRIDVTRDGRAVTTLRPEKRRYGDNENITTEAAITNGLTRDLYVSLGEALTGGAWIVRVYVKPFILWIWFGCALMAFGGVLAVSDRRYRSKAAATEQAASEAASA